MKRLKNEFPNVDWFFIVGLFGVFVTAPIGMMLMFEMTDLKLGSILLGVTFAVVTGFESNHKFLVKKFFFRLLVFSLVTYGLTTLIATTRPDAMFAFLGNYFIIEILLCIFIPMFKEAK